MFIKIDEEKIKNIQEITMTDYETLGDMLPCENVEAILDDLVCEIHRLQEMHEDYVKEIEENYELKEVDPYEYNGVSIKDFI